MITSVNPATNEIVESFEPHSPAEIETRLSRSATAARHCRSLSFVERARRMHAAAAILEERQQEFGRLMSREMGKPLRAAVAEVLKSSWVCSFYADNAEAFLGDEDVETPAQRSFIHYEPLGVVLAVMPWNFPFWQVFRFAAPALMAGNAGLLKHASNVPCCALMIEEVFVQAGFDQGEFQTLLIGSHAVQGILADRRVAAATLTGSEAAGIAVASECGAQIKKTVLELGGSDPFIIMPSAKLDEAVRVGVKARTMNNGQSCIAAKRFIIHESIADDVTERFVAAMSALKVGDPMEDDTDIGPLATPQILDEIEEQVNRSVAAGARVLCGGRRVGEKGNFYAPTILTDIPPGAPAYDQELFGPVASIFRVPDIDQAIELANATSFGLGASAWTADPEEQKRFIDSIEAGSVFINAMVASDPRLPFGGIKRSGYGRELGAFGIREFVNVKTVWIQG